MSQKKDKLHRKQATEMIVGLQSNMTFFDRINYALFRNFFKPLMRTQKKLKDPKYFKALTKSRSYIWSWLFDDGYYKRLFQKQKAARDKQFREEAQKAAEKHGKYIAERKAEKLEAEQNRIWPVDPATVLKGPHQTDCLAEEQHKFRVKAFKDAKPSDVDDLK